MGTNTLGTYSNGTTIDASHPNEITEAINGVWVGRNSSGVPTTGQSLGTAALPWGTMYSNSVVVGGDSVDFSQISSKSNRVVAGQNRTLSSMADFLRADGAAATVTIEGASTNLDLVIRGTTVQVTADLDKTGLSTAPGSNNTCLVDDTTLTGQNESKYIGEEGTVLTVDTMGSEITSLVGQFATFKLSTEYFYAYVKSTTELTNVFRGFFFDSAGSRLPREVISNNDTITLMKTAWVFVEDNATTVDVTYRPPVSGYVAPSSPITGDYWLDIGAAKAWKRYSGTEWVIIDRILLGIAVIDTSNCVATRSVDFFKTFDEQNNLELEILSTEVVQGTKPQSSVSVNGSLVEHEGTFPTWNITTDRESGVSETADTMYYLYLSENGQRVISDIKPYDRPDLQGWYHPFESWRLVGQIYNESGSDIDLVSDEVSPFSENLQLSSTTSTSSTSYVDATGFNIKYFGRGRPLNFSLQCMVDNSGTAGALFTIQSIDGTEVNEIQTTSPNLSVRKAHIHSITFKDPNDASIPQAFTRFDRHEYKIRWKVGSGTANMQSDQTMEVKEV